MIYSTCWKALNNCLFVFWNNKNIPQINYENAWIKYVVVISTADLKPQELIQSAFQVSKKKKKLVCSRKHLEKLWSCFVNFNYQWKAKVSYLVLIKMCSDLAFYLVKPGLVANHSFLWLPMHLLTGEQHSQSWLSQLLSVCARTENCWQWLSFRTDAQP